MKLTSSGKITYTLNTEPFNPGVYEFTFALNRRDNRAPLALCPDRLKFILKGNDITKGGPLKLDDTWRSAK
jgi:hypothetical protein